MHVNQKTENYCFYYSYATCLKKRQKMSPEKVKEELLLPLWENVDENESVLNEAVRNAKQPNEVIQIIKRYEPLLKGETKKMKFLMKFRESKEFFNHVSPSRSNIYVKSRLYKLLTKFPVSKTSSLSPSSFESNLKVIRNVFKEPKIGLFGKKD